VLSKHPYVGASSLGDTHYSASIRRAVLSPVPVASDGG